MTIKQWSLTVLTLGAVYLSGYLIQYLDDVMWFAASSAVSLAAIRVITAISTGIVPASLAGIELVAIGMAGLSFSQSFYNVFVYSNYGVIIEQLALVQALILIIVGLYCGTITVCKRDWNANRLGSLFRSHVCAWVEVDSSMREEKT